MMDVSNWKAEYRAVFEILSGAPKTWTPFEFNNFTGLQENTATLLIERGLLEIKRSVRLVLPAHPTSFLVTYTATGIEGSHLALKSILEELKREWGEPVVRWEDGGMADSPPFHEIETGKPDEWRLSDQGEISLDAVESNDQYFWGYVFRQVYPYELLADWKGVGSATVTGKETGFEEPKVTSVVPDSGPLNGEEKVSKYRFIDQEATYEICFNGVSVNLPAIQGFGAIRSLLCRPGEILSIEDLTGEAKIFEGGKINQETVKEYGGAIKGLELELAESSTGVERKEEIEIQLNRLKVEVAKITKPGGVRSEGIEVKASDALRKNLGNSIKAIEKHIPEMAQHLNTHLKLVKGKGRRYTGELTWQTE